MNPVRQRIEELLVDMEEYREAPDQSGFTDTDHLLTYVENELEDCMLELLNLPIPEHRSLLDRVIRGVDRLGAVGASVGKLIDLFR